VRLWGNCPIKSFSFVTSMHELFSDKVTFLRDHDGAKRNFVAEKIFLSGCNSAILIKDK
jgi:hypothetical protein